MIIYYFLTVLYNEFYIHFFNTYFSSCLNREKLNEITWNVISRYIQTNSTGSFDFLQFVLRINLELFNYLFQRIENIILECERNRRPNAASLRSC